LTEHRISKIFVIFVETEQDSRNCAGNDYTRVAKLCSTSFSKDQVAYYDHDMMMRRRGERSLTAVSVEAARWSEQCKKKRKRKEPVVAWPGGP
jgi:hypothetical protein